MTKIEVLSVILAEQENSAPVKLTLGYTDSNNHVHHNYIVVHSAPPKVIKKLMTTEDIYPVLEDGVGLVIRCSEE